MGSPQTHVLSCCRLDRTTRTWHAVAAAAAPWTRDPRDPAADGSAAAAALDARVAPGRPARRGFKDGTLPTAPPTVSTETATAVIVGLTEGSLGSPKSLASMPLSPRILPKARGLHFPAVYV